MALVRCTSCRRRIPARSRRCIWCKRWSGQPHLKDAEGLEAELHALSAFGVLTALAVAFLGAALVDGHPAAFATAQALGGSLLVTSLLLLVFAWALDVALALHVVLVALALWAGSYGAAIGLSVVCFGALRRGTLRALIRGQGARGWSPPVTDMSRCVRCGRPAVGVRAPRLVVSAVFVAISSPGLPRPRCLTHARLAAIPATIATLLFGWWSIWGVFWTPPALYQNVVNGGVETLEGTEDAEKIARIGWFRFLLPGLAGLVGIANWLVVVSIVEVVTR